MAHGRLCTFSFLILPIPPRFSRIPPGDAQRCIVPASKDVGDTTRYVFARKASLIGRIETERARGYAVNRETNAPRIKHQSVTQNRSSFLKILGVCFCVLGSNSCRLCAKAIKRADTTTYFSETLTTVLLKSVSFLEPARAKVYRAISFYIDVDIIVVSVVRSIELIRMEHRFKFRGFIPLIITSYAGCTA